MELQVQEYKMPEPIVFNYDELKAELTERVKVYEATVYDDKQIKEAKADRADLNRLKKALNDERIRREREYMEPFNDFKNKIAEIISIIDKPVAVIDKQVKAYEEKCKAEKRDAILAAWADTVQAGGLPEWVNLDRLFDDKWLNASVNMKTVSEALAAIADRIKADIQTLEALPAFSFEALEEYKRGYDLNKAITEGQRLADIQRRKEAAEAARKTAESAPAVAEPINAPAEQAAPVTDEKPAEMWVSFRALLTVEQAKELKEFFNAKGIQFEAIR